MIGDTQDATYEEKQKLSLGLIYLNVNNVMVK